MSKYHKIILGTASFEPNYGFKKIKISKKKIFEILRFAKKKKLIIDTSRLYGSSLYYLKNLKFSGKRVISKFSKNINICKPEDVEKEFLIDINILNTKKILGYLIHNSNVFFLKDADKYYKNLINLKKKNIIDNIGVSVYSISEAKKILKKFKLDIIQIPINAMNLNSKMFNFLKLAKKKKVKIHARSIFLQGTLVSSIKKNEYIKNYNLKLEKILKKKKINKVNYLFNLINSQKLIDKIVIGVENLDQLKELIYLKRSKFENFLLNKNIKNNHIDPRNWN